MTEVFNPSTFIHTVTNDCNRTNSSTSSLSGENEEPINIFRYKLSDDMMVEIHNFAKLHEYDHRKDFKEAWSKWLECNDELIVKEVSRLTTLGCNKDIVDKMYKSARYYFRKKSTIKKEPVKRRVYTTLTKEFIQCIDDHIGDNIFNLDFKPSTSFDIFCNDNMDMLKTEVKQLSKQGLTDAKNIKDKIKKTYQNRYFLIIKK
jgi:hypothetical protein